MSNLRACFVVATLALAACGESGNSNVDAAVDSQPDAKIWMDAALQNYDFSCMGNAAPTTVAAQVTLSGTVQRVSFNGQISIEALADADLLACPAADANCDDDDGNDTSASDGTFSIGPITTGGTSLNDYIEMTGTDARTVLTYPPSPFIADQPGIPILTFHPDLVPLLGAFGCNQNDTGNGMVGLAFADCSNAPMTDTGNVVVSVKQGGNEVQGTSVIELGPLNPAAAGAVLVCNVPANATTTVGGSYGGMPLRAHDVKVVAGTTTTTLVRPGY